MQTYRVIRDVVEWCEVQAENEDEARKVAHEDGLWEQSCGSADPAEYRVESEED